MAKATKIKNVEARYSDPTGVIFVPWTDGDTIGSTGYDVFSIVGDTFSVTQDDPDTTEIPHEFSDTPLDENTSMGTAKLTMQCLDFDDDLLVELFGCTKKDIDNYVLLTSQPSDWSTGYANYYSKSGDNYTALTESTEWTANTYYKKETKSVIAFPAEYKDLFCLVQLEFADKVVVFPKVKMNSKAVFENLRSDIARGELSGTLYNTDVKVGDTPSGDNAVDNIVDTPRLHIPAGVKYTVGGTISGGKMTGGTVITVKSGSTETDIAAAS